MSLSLLAALIAPTAGEAQRPDFTGQWVVSNPDAEKPSVASVGDGAFKVGNMGGGWGSPLTISQQAQRLTIAYPFFATYDLQPLVSFTFSTDGSESRNTLMLGHAASELRSRASWRDSALVISTLYHVPYSDAMTEVRQSLRLESATTLVVETTRMGLPGTTPSVIRAVYAKR